MRTLIGSTVYLAVEDSTYLLLTEFEVHTVSYVRRSVNYTTHRENEVSKIFFISGFKEKEGREDFNQAERPFMIAVRQILNVRTIYWFPHKAT